MSKRSSNLKKTFLIHLYVTLAGWAAAFAIVYPILLVFGEQLAKLPPALEAVIFTGILVTVMGNVVMPVLQKIIVQYVEKKM